MFRSKWLLWTVILSVFLVLPGSAVMTAALAADVPMVPANFPELAENAKPGVVNIRTERVMKSPGRVFRHFFNNPYEGRPNNPFEDFFNQFEQPNQREYKQRSLGSGFIIDKDGYIITNNHVIEDADEIKVQLTNEEEYPATVIGRDPRTDLALIKIDGAKKLNPLPLGDSESLKVGSWVLAIGSPFGLDQTVTAGIVSYKKRVIDFNSYADFIQTDASINPGNSGGPLLDLSGRVVGINTAIIANGQGIGFAIPIDLAKTIIAELKEKGEVTRGWLGVGIQPVTSELAEYYGLKDDKGVLVTQVFKGDPAEKAGIQKGDVITAINDKKVTTTRELSNIIASVPVGSKTNIAIVRNGDQMTLSAVVTKRLDKPNVATKEPIGNEDLGLQVADLTAERSQRFGLDADEKGVLVVDVLADGRAAKAGIQIGDIIKGINRKRVENIGDYNNYIEKADKDDPLLVLISRRNEMLAIKIMP